ncbi:MAG: BT_3987 domain-containing protein [Bacteroidales bacterium]
MKKIEIKIFSILAASLMMFSSCLKDSDYDNGVTQSTHGSQNQNFVEVHLTTGDNSNTVSRSYDASDVELTLDMIPINLTSGPAEQDVTIDFDTLGLADATIADMNTTDGILVPTKGSYTLVNGLKVVIPKGQSTGYVKVKFKPNDFVGDTYVIGIKIKSISDSKYSLSNLVTGYVKIGIKNMYDGEYEVDGTMVDAVNPGLTAAYPAKVWLITQGSNSVGYWDVDVWNNYFHAIKNGASFSGYGSFAPVFKFDASNNVIEVVNIYGQPAGNGRSAQLDPSGVNKYDPATKTLKVTYWMNQPGSSHRTHFDETFTYLGPR